MLDASSATIQSYLWNNGATSPSLTVSQSGTYSILATATNGCTAKDTINVNVVAIPVFNLGRDTTICEDASLTLNAKVTGASYQWSDGSVNSSIVVADAGTYWARASLYGCVYSDTISITEKPIPSVDLGADTVMCEGATKLLNAFNENASYTWSDGSTSPVYTVSTPGRYAVTVNKYGCVATDTINILYNSRPEISLGADRAICTGQTYDLSPTAANNYTFKWQNNSTMREQSIREPGTYYVDASNECGTTSDTIIVTKGVCLLILPNAFTPNGDGVNDDFGIKDAGFITTFQMTIFNRWGNVVFRTNNPNQRWDGRMNGQMQPVDNYVWQVSLVTNDGESQSGRGTVQLLR